MLLLELETKVLEEFTIMEKAQTRAFSATYRFKLYLVVALRVLLPFWKRGDVVHLHRSYTAISSALIIRTVLHTGIYHQSGNYDNVRSHVKL